MSGKAEDELSRRAPWSAVPPDSSSRPTPAPQASTPASGALGHGDIWSSDALPPRSFSVLPQFAEQHSVDAFACEHADVCGGCPLIHLGYHDQLAHKRGRVVQSASRYPSLELLYTEPLVAAEPIVGYRTRAKLIVAPGARIGLFAKGGGHQVVDIPQCRVVTDALVKAAQVLRTLLADDEADGGLLAPFDPTGRGALRAVDLREIQSNDGVGVLITLVLQRSRAERDLLRYRGVGERISLALPSLLGVAVNLHDGESPQVLGGETHVVYGIEVAQDTLGTASHAATYGSFVQAHRGQAQRIHQLLADALGLHMRTRASDTSLGISPAPGTSPPARVLDLYGGSGAIALSLASLGAKVTLVEAFAPAASHAESAARAQGLDLTAHCSDVAQALRELRAAHETFDAAVVNPPRRGMSPLARENLARLGVSTIAYVSCAPETLARDLDHLTRLGYSGSILRPLDMIPLTDEVETVAVLRKTGPAAPRLIYEDDDIVVLEKACHEPILPRAEYMCCLLERARRLPEGAGLLALHDLDAGVSGLAILARTEKAANAWREMLNAASTRRVFLGAARGVIPTKGTIARPLRDGQKTVLARTRYRRLAISAGHSVLRIIPEAARPHQVRRHLAAIGHPIVGDDRYGHAPTNRFFEEKYGLDRPFLHCVRLEIDHPVTGQRIQFEAPLPGDLRAVLERAGGTATVRFLDHKNALGTSSVPPPPDSFVPAVSIPTSSAFFIDLGSVPDLDRRDRPSQPELTLDDDDNLGRER